MCAATKSTLNLMNCEFVSTKPFKEPHPIWRHVHPNARDVRRATIKARLLSGTYLLQTNVSTFSKRQVSPNCPLCAQEPEDRTHFLLRCPKLEQRRRPLMEEIFVTFQDLSEPTHIGDGFLYLICPPFGFLYLICPPFGFLYLMSPPFVIAFTNTTSFEIPGEIRYKSWLE